MRKRKILDSVPISSTKRRRKEASDTEYDDDDDFFIPDPDHSGSSDSDNPSSSDSENNHDSDDSGSSDPSDAMDDFQYPSYRNVLDECSKNRKKLEPGHEFTWIDGEKAYTDDLKDEIILSESIKKKIRASSHVDLFHFFFSKELKTYIIEASNENGLDISHDELDIFLGIILLSTYNKRNDQQEYWSKDPDLKCEFVSSAMSRKRFLEIKSKLKFSKITDQNDSDKAWRIRKILDIFRENIQQFGFFSTGLSVDEMMARFFGRTILRQFLPSKPDRFGLKFWGLCNTFGYLFNLDIYCGKNSSSSSDCENCALGSKVVMQMVKPLLLQTTKTRLHQYHLTFDNYFTSPDLILHLKKLGLRATGTVRKGRVSKNEHTFNKGALRGSYKVSHDKNSGINYVSVMDSKKVSLLSTAAGVSPLVSKLRYSQEHKQKVNYDFPSIISFYNYFMGGVDDHDFRCKKVLPSIQAKRWTWAGFVKILQSSVTNATALWNMCCNKGKRRLRTKDMCRSISKLYIEKSKKKNMSSHKTESKKRHLCTGSNCSQRTSKYCINCEAYYCKNCYSKLHAQ